MSTSPSNKASTAIPCLRYRDAPRAIDWLCAAFGFTPHLVVPGENGAIAHAQLNSAGGMIMLGSASNEGQYGALVVQPVDINGAQTQTTYLVVDDADAVYDRAKEAGAAIVIDIVDEEYGGRGFTCRDIEGHVWSIGTYDPWQQQESGPETDEQAIRSLIETWLRATREGDVDTVLHLMTPDVVFLVPGQPAMHGREAFEQGLRGMLATHAIDSSSEIEEVCVAGDMAYCRTKLSVTITSKHGNTPMQRSGHTLSILRKAADGKWQLARDANLLGAPG